MDFNARCGYHLRIRNIVLFENKNFVLHIKIIKDTLQNRQQEVETMVPWATRREQVRQGMEPCTFAVPGGTFTQEFVDVFACV